ncbi:MAG: hypothetical protein FWE76_03710 [Symbiobacteriaceae bacterium]|nr:hypothetical protein [Symbiobacteriaceae bacterium]
MEVHKYKRYRFLFLTPILLLVINAFYFSAITQEIDKALLEEKYGEIILAVDMLSEAIEANPSRFWEEHEHNIVHSVEFLDKQHQIYAEVFKVDGDDLVSITRRYAETSLFEVFSYPLFRSAIASQNSGKLSIGYTPEHQDYRDLLLYFSWTPLYSDPSQRYLIVAGVSHHSVTVAIAEWVTIGQLASMAATFLINVMLVLLLTRLSHLYGIHGGSTRREGS